MPSGCVPSGHSRTCNVLELVASVPLATSRSLISTSLGGSSAASVGDLQSTPYDSCGTFL